MIIIPDPQLAINNFGLVQLPMLFLKAEDQKSQATYESQFQDDKYDTESERIVRTNEELFPHSLGALDLFRGKYNCC